MDFMFPDLEFGFRNLPKFQGNAPAGTKLEYCSLPASMTRRETLNKGKRKKEKTRNKRDKRNKRKLKRLKK